VRGARKKRIVKRKTLNLPTKRKNRSRQASGEEKIDASKGISYSTRAVGTGKGSVRRDIAWRRVGKDP